VLQQKNNIVVSSIAEYLMNLFLGGINGDIHIVKKTALYFEKDGIADNINKSRLCQAKSYVGHVSFVNQIEIDAKELSKELCLYTTGINDQAIFQWSIQIAELYWDIDHMPHDITKEDVFMAEVEPRDKYFNIINELLPLRDEIIELQQKIDETVEVEIELKLEKVIGRKAYNRRNNLFISVDNNLVFSSGSMICKINIPENAGIIQDKGPYEDEPIVQKF
jgi:hypothetical protein